MEKSEDIESWEWHKKTPTVVPLCTNYPLLDSCEGFYLGETTSQLKKSKRNETLWEDEKATKQSWFVESK